jgi:hypothetical protein
MSDSGIGGYVIVVGILAAETLIEQPLETSVTIFGVESGEIIISHLIHDYADHQFGSIEFIL